MYAPPAAPPPGIDQLIDRAFQPIATFVSQVVFVAIPIGGAEVPLIVAWLIAGATFFTLALRGINLRGFRHALRIVLGREDASDDPGSVSHFQALSTAVSGTVGVGNIAHVAVAVSVGGPGAAFWMAVAGFLGMASKFAECSLGVKYRRTNPDGSFSGGPMYYLSGGLATLGWPRLGRGLALYYALCVLFGSVGIGMFQANQAYVQLVTVTGGSESLATGRGWLVGLLLALSVGAVILGGITSIARFTEKLVPAMVILYLGCGFLVIGANAEHLPGALQRILVEAFTPKGAAGGFLGVVVLGFRRAAFSNEAGIGSSSIAHSVVRTSEPLTQGFVAMLEPFIDTVIVCSITALIITTGLDPSELGTGVASGVEMTSTAFGRVHPMLPSVLSVVVFLFAYSTLISWSYYGLEGCVYLIGDSRRVRMAFNLFYCLCAIVGCTTTLSAILEFTDAMVFAMAFANLIGLYFMAPGLRSDLDRYWKSIRARDRANDRAGAGTVEH
ncbi:alanine:cation symporter family protein [Myxococcota bacterium]|nr:alanine:cation symporter family protein [Myxococcota bacterium]